jgi:hypothetical protein
MTEDDLFRSTEVSAQASRESLNRLTVRSESDLYAALAASVRDEANARRKSMTPSPDAVNRSRSRANTVDEIFKIRINVDDLLRDRESVALGERIFRRWSLVLHDFLCNPANDDKELRQRVMSAIVGKDTGATAFISAFLVTSFALSIPVAAVGIARLSVESSGSRTHPLYDAFL